MTKTGAGRLVAVVVTYNRLEKLEVTLSRLMESPDRDLAAIVVVDNASIDLTAKWLAEQDDPRLDVIRSETNRGGAGGFEAGMRRAVTVHAPDWVVVMDDDGRPAPGALAAFHDLDLTGWDGIAAAVYFPDGKICEMNRPSRNPFWHLSIFLRTVRRVGGRSGFHLDPLDYQSDQPRAVDITSFVGFFISRAAIERIGYPDPGLFVYGDDGIYTLGLRQAGGQIAFQPTVQFEHDCSTFAGQRGRFRPLWKVYYYHRNLLMLYRQASGWLFWPLLLVVLPKWILKIRDHAGERRVFLRLMRRAVWHGLCRRTAVEHAQVQGWVEGAEPFSPRSE